MANQRELDRAGWVTASVAAVGMAVCQVNGVKDCQPIWFDAVRQFREACDREQRVPAHVVRVFLALATEHKIPSWALKHFDLKDFVRRGE